MRQFASAYPGIFLSKSCANRTYRNPTGEPVHGFEGNGGSPFPIQDPWYNVSGNSFLHTKG